MKKNEITKKAKSIISVFALILVAATLVFLSSCGDDGGDEVDPIVGTWKISLAKLNEATPDTVPQTNTKLPAGTEVTELFAGIIATAGPCVSNPSGTAIQLTEDKKMLYVCIGGTEGPDETGTWLLSNDGSTLTISILTEAFGTPQTVPLNLSPFTATSTTLSGTIENFAFFPSKESQYGVQTVSIDVAFTKVQ